MRWHSSHALALNRLLVQKQRVIPVIFYLRSFGRRTDFAVPDRVHVCVYVCMRLPIFTAGEDKRTGVFVHWEIMELQLAFCVDGHPGQKERRRETEILRQRHSKD